MPISLSSLRPSRPAAASTAAANGSAAPPARDPGALQAGARERNMPRAVLGATLVAVCTLTAGYLRVTSSIDVQVLRLTQRVAAGEVIEASDLSSVAVKTGSSSGLISAGAESLVVGRTAAVTLVAGGYLTSGQVGPAGLPAGQAEVEVSVKFGAYPADLAAGARVAVSSLTSSSSTSSSSTAGVVPLSGDPQATVIAVSPSSSGDGSAGVELSATSSAAASINAIPAGQAVLAVVSASGE